MKSMRGSIVLLTVFVGSLIAPLNAVPVFDINLDELPERRWKGVASYYQKEMVSMLDKLIPIMDTTYGDKKDSWINEVEFDPEYEAELKGIAEAIGHPTVVLDRLKWLNMLYEMDSPYASACSGVLWAMPNGTVMQGRNMDDFSADEPLVDWPAITFDANLYRNGQLIMRMTQWPGSVGVHTAMRFSDKSGSGGWGFAQNTRKPNAWEENLVAAKKGGQIFGLAVRRIMETTPDFDTAMNLIYGAKFMAPQYFIMSGNGPFKGVVLTIDRLGQHKTDSPAIQRVSNTSETWHLVQTNDDLLAEAEDPRRPLANYLLRSSSRDITLSQDNLLQFMHTTMVLNSGTIFTTVMVPETGYYYTILPDEPPAIVDGSAMSQSLMMSYGEPVGFAVANPFALNQNSVRISPSISRFASQQRRVKSRATRKRRFLAPPLAPGTHAELHHPSSGAASAALDDTSFMQTSSKLNAGADL